MTHSRRQLLIFGVFVLANVTSSAVFGQKAYDPGVSDTEIKIGSIVPYSGPASAYAAIGKIEAAYFRKINDEGGIAGRKINFISYDDAYSPPKTMEQARRLVENDEVLLIFNSIGTSPNTAIQKYMNLKKVPQLFVGSGAYKWNDPEHFPWTMGWNPSFRSEGNIYAKYLLEHHPNGKIAILFQNDDVGKDYVKGFKDGLSGKMEVVAEASYDVFDTNADSQVVKLKAANADIFFNASTPKFAALAIKKVAELGWKPVHLLVNVASNVGAVLKPAGFDNAKGILSTGYLKDPTDPTWSDDADLKDWLAFMSKYSPGGDLSNASNVYGYVAAQALVQVIKQCKDNLTRENVMKEAANLKGLRLGMMRPGISINTDPADYAPFKQLQMQRFNGEAWEAFGPIISIAGGS
jgi:branched-chain amino acid transport system substrate-binding protein